MTEFNLNGFIKFPTKSQKKFKSIKWKVKGEEYVGGTDVNDPNPHIKIPLSIKAVFSEDETYTLLDQVVKIYIGNPVDPNIFTTYSIQQEPPMTGTYKLINDTEIYGKMYLDITSFPIQPVLFHWREWIEGDIFSMTDVKNDYRLIDKYGFPDPRTLEKIELVFEPVIN